MNSVAKSKKEMFEAFITKKSGRGMYSKHFSDLRSFTTFILPELQQLMKGNVLDSGVDYSERAGDSISAANKETTVKGDSVSHQTTKKKMKSSSIPQTDNESTASILQEALQVVLAKRRNKSTHIAVDDSNDNNDKQ